jgi:hypothetical protein
MDPKKEILKALLALGIKTLMSLIPWLAGFTTGPIGWVVGLLIGYLSGKLADWILLLAKLKEIENTVHKEVADLNAAKDALALVQKDPNATKEQHDKARKDFLDSFTKLADWRVRNG